MMGPKDTHRIVRILSFTVRLLLMTGAIATQAVGQSRPAAYGPGSYIQVGGTGSIFQADYGQRKLGGDSVFIDAHLYRRVGIEVEARGLHFNQDEGVHETTYLAGPHLSLLTGRFRPYGKLLFGRGDFYFPFHYAKGSYFVIAPGAGVDWQVGKSRLTVRLVDVEYQDWPLFSYGPLKPYGVSSGIAVRVF